MTSRAGLDDSHLLSKMTPYLTSDIYMRLTKLYLKVAMWWCGGYGWGGMA